MPARTVFQSLSAEVRAWFVVGGRLIIDLPEPPGRSRAPLTIISIDPREDTFTLAQEGEQPFTMQVNDLFWFKPILNRLSRLG